MGPRRVLDIKTDWPTDRRSEHNFDSDFDFDFDFDAMLQLPKFRLCLGQLQTTSSLYMVWVRSPAQGIPGKGQYSIVADMLQLQVGGRRGTSSLQLSRLQARQGRNAKKNVAEIVQDYNPHLSRTILRCGANQQQAATAADKHGDCI
jgi:hypothetical protein